MTCLLGSCFQNEVHLVSVDSPTEESAKALKERLSSLKSMSGPTEGNSKTMKTCDKAPVDTSAEHCDSSQSDQETLSVLSR